MNTANITSNALAMITEAMANEVTEAYELKDMNQVWKNQDNLTTYLLGVKLLLEGKLLDELYKRFYGKAPIDIAH